MILIRIHAETANRILIFNVATDDPKKPRYETTTSVA